MPAGDQTEGFVIGPNDKTYSVSDIPMMKARIASNPAFASLLQPLIDRLEAGDFDQPWIGNVDDPNVDDPTVATETDTTPPGATNQEDISAAVAAAMEAAGLGPNFNFSDVMTAADAKELFQGMDTGQIEANVLQKMGIPDFLTNQQVQDAINTALGETDSLSEDDVLRMIQESTGADVDLSNYMSKSDIAQAIQASTSQFLTPDMIQQMITNAQLQGMSEEDIFAMIQEVSGGMMSDEDIMAAIATAQETQYTSLMDEINKLIADSLAQGMSEEDILALIQEQYGEQMTDDQIAGGNR